jgi:hypothetical protein
MTNFSLGSCDISEIVKVLLASSSVTNQATRAERNLVDPFAAALETVLNGYASQKEWERAEVARRNQKSLMNYLGDAQQKIIGALPGCHSHPTGSGHPDVSVVRDSQRLIAEVKNKHNTMNYNSSRETYDELSKHLSRPEYKGFIALVVTLIAPASEPRIKHFAPGDKPKRDDILIVSGRVFYAIATDPLCRTPSTTLATTEDIPSWQSWTAIDSMAELFFSEVEKQSGLNIPKWIRDLTTQAFQ